MRGSTTGYSSPGTQTSSSRLASPTTATSTTPTSSSAAGRRVDLRAARRRRRRGWAGRRTAPAATPTSGRSPPAPRHRPSASSLAPRSASSRLAAAEPAGEHLVHRRGVVGGPGLVAAHDEPAVLGLARQAVLEDDHRADDLGALHVADVEALDAQRGLVELEGVLQLLQRLAAGGEVAGPGHLVPGQALLGVAGHGLHQGALVAAARHPQVDPAPAQRRTATARGPRRRRAAPARAPRAARRRRPRCRRPAGGGARRPRAVVSASRSATQPRWPRTRPPRTWNSWTATSSSSSARANTSASVRVGQHDGRLLEHPLERPDVVAQPGGPLEVELGRGGLHLAGEPGQEPAGLAGHEVAEVLGDLAVPLRRRPGRRTGRCTCRCSRAGTGRPDLAGPLEHPGRAGAHREDAQGEVEGLADRPGVRVGAEVAGALALGAAHHLGPRELLAQGDREVGVGLVVAVLDVEPRVELLDPAVLELERLDLGA